MKISINNKVFILFISIVIIFAVFSISSTIVINDFHRALINSSNISKKVNLTGNLQFQVNKLLLPVSHYLISGDIKERDNFDSIINDMSKLFAELRTFSRDDTRWNDVVKKVQEDAIVFGENAVNILYVENPRGDNTSREQMAKLNLLGDSLIKEVDEFHDISVEEINLMERDAIGHIRKIREYGLIIIGILLFFALFISYYLHKFVIDPILKMNKGAGIVAKGDLKHRLVIHTGDEIEDLAVQFNKMTSSLEDAKIELDRKLFELYTLYNVSKVLSTSFEMEELLSRIVDNISKGLNINGVVIMLINNSSRELYVASHTDFDGKNLRDIKFKMGEGLYGLTAVTGVTKIIKEVEKDATVNAVERFSSEVNSIITAPFGVRGKIIGLLNVYKNKPEIFDEKDVKLIKTVAEHVALALENVRLYEETKILSITDGLTGLYNHRFFKERIKLEIARSKRYRHPLSLIMADIDDFKHYNDAHGHLQGDAVLRQVSGIIKENLRNTDFVARYGGEEFVIMLPETEKEEACAIAEKIRKKVENNFFLYQDTQPGGNFTISLGVSTLNMDAGSEEELIKMADDALYKAKEQGRNKVVPDLSLS